MKTLHRPDLYAWSSFDTERNVDFNSVFWARPGGNVAVDPMPLTAHDRAHIAALGGLAWIVITNADHVRDSVALAEATGAQICAPRAETAITSRVDRWLDDRDEVVAGLEVVAMPGSKTPGEVALVLDKTTLITGDVIRAHQADRLHLLPAGRLTDADAVRAAIRGIVDLFPIETVLVGDGWPMFRGAAERLRALVDAVPTGAAAPPKATAC